MNAAQLIELMNRTPFEPLEVRLSDGTLIRAEHPYNIATGQNSPTFIIYQDDDRMRIVAYRNVNEVITTATAS